jgi:hypothetical protein
MGIHLPMWLVWVAIGVAGVFAAGPLLGLVAALIERRSTSPSDMAAIEASAKDWLSRKS